MGKILLRVAHLKKQYGNHSVQRAYCQNCCLTTRDKYFAIFAVVARVDKVLGSSNFGNMQHVVGNSRTACEAKKGKLRGVKKEKKNVWNG
jgi:hypothetical protein